MNSTKRALFFVILSMILLLLFFFTCTQPVKNKEEDDDKKINKKDYTIDIRFIKSHVSSVFFNYDIYGRLIGIQSSWTTDESKNYNFECNNNEKVYLDSYSVTINALNENEVSIIWEPHNIVVNCLVNGSKSSNSWYSNAKSYKSGIYYYDIGTICETVSATVIRNN